MFSPSNMLLKYLSAQPRDIYDIVGALEGYINADPKFQTNDFMEAINYVLKNGVSESELFQPFNPTLDFIEDESKWDYEYYLLARVYMKDNFCKRRINHVRAIAKKLYPEVKSPIQTSTIAQSKSEQPNQRRDSVNRIQTGGQKESGKKTQDQRGGANYQITKKQGNVKMRDLISIVLIALLVVMVLLLVFIIKR